MVSVYLSKMTNYKLQGSDSTDFRSLGQITPYPSSPAIPNSISNPKKYLGGNCPDMDFRKCFI